MRSRFSPQREQLDEAGSLLGGGLRLGEIKSVERFCRRVLDERLQTMGAFLNPTEYDHALSYRRKGGRSPFRLRPPLVA